MASVISKILAQQERLELEEAKIVFENLKDGDFKKTSDADSKYNCIAFAAEETHRKWWPVHYTMASKDVYWPDDVPKVRLLKNFILAFETLGYEPCDSAELEKGFQKVAIYVTTTASADAFKGAPLHMARQLPSGEWTSKLGDKMDITHKALENMEGKKYGVVKQILKRSINKMEKTKPKKSKEFENFENLARDIINTPKKENNKVKEQQKKKGKADK